MNDDRVFSLKFEDLAGEKRAQTVQAIVEYYLACRGELITHRDRLVKRAMAMIAPHRSHTYRRGTFGGWRDVFGAQHREAMKKVAGKLLVELGYERDENW